MELWLIWWNVVAKLRGAFSRSRTFYWFVLVLVGMTIREDCVGVTSLIRALRIRDFYYDRILDFFHSKAVNRALLTKLWVAVVLKLGCAFELNGRVVIIGDGIKAPKEGKKMPASRVHHQQSGSNSKPEYIMGHSCQAIALCCFALKTYFALPLAIQIHEGLVFSNRDTRTLMDKMNDLIAASAISIPMYFLGDAYYACQKVARYLIRNNNHLITRVRSNAVAYKQADAVKKRKRGRPKKYGEKVKLADLFENETAFLKEKSPVYGETTVEVRHMKVDLIWQQLGRVVRFVLVIHPNRGKIILMSTDTTLEPLQIIKAYGLRFKIEFSFKQAVNVIGTFAYHFWMKAMTPIKRGSKNQHLHKKTDEYRNQVRRKMDAYHLFMQVCLIAHGLLNYIAATAPTLVWKSFGSWIRTIRPGIPPSELVTKNAMRNTANEFLLGKLASTIFGKFFEEKIGSEPQERLNREAG